MPALIVRVSLILALVTAPSVALAQSSCALSPVFLLLRQVAGVDVIGDCKEPPSIAENGDITQVTTRGLAVYRYSDQVIAFTDGQTSWLYGPEGLQKRPNDERFAWEQQRQAERPTLAAPQPPTPTARPSTPTPAPKSKLTPALAAKCSNLGFDLASEMAPAIGGEAATFGQMITGQCRGIVEEHGEAGFACYEPAARQFVREGSRFVPGPGSAEAAVNGFRARVELCLSNLD